MQSNVKGKDPGQTPPVLRDAPGETDCEILKGLNLSVDVGRVSWVDIPSQLPRRLPLELDHRGRTPCIAI